MKRQRSFKSDGIVNTNEGEQGFWPSYTDMMSSVALILFFLMLIAYLQNMITGNRLISTQDRLKETEDSLAATMIQIQDAKDELSALSLDLESARINIQAQQDQIAASNALISDQEKMIADQDAYIALTTDELTRLRSNIQTIAYMRLSVLEQIQSSIVSSLGDKSQVSVGESGNIILSENLLFDFISTSIKENGHAFLDKLASAFTKLLSNENDAQYIESILISGHTDSKGSAEYNRELSTGRANSVLTYLLGTNRGSLEKYSQYFCAAGYGATRPVQSNDTDAGRSANRRIEISIILKDESVLEVINSYLEKEMPDLKVSVGAGQSGNVQP